MTDVIGHEECPRCVAKGGDTSGDNLVLYADGGKHCFACNYHVSSYKEKIDYEKEYEVVGSAFTPEVIEGVKSITSYDPKGWRGLRKDTCEYLGIRHEYDTQTGKIKKQYYPCTIKGGHSGWKIRHEPKDFSSIGTTGKEADLFNWWRFQKSTQKKCVISSGEIDAISAFQMLSDYTKKKGQEDYGFVPVVSGTLGEKAVSQIKAAYEWFDKFDQIIICYDNDDVGREAVEDVVKVLPRGKVYVMDLVLKDANEYLKQGKEAEFVNIFFKARKHTPSGVVGSDVIVQQLIEKALVQKITLPEFLEELSKMLAGGFRLKSIVNIIAGTSIGKTSLVNAIIKHILFKCPYLVGVVTLESDVAEYGSSLLSEHIGRKLALIEDTDELQEVLNSDFVRSKSKELFQKEDGSPRFYLIDDRGDFSSLQSKIEELIISCGVQIILIDPLSDALAGLSPEDQELFMSWQKQMKKAYDVMFLNVIHIRKAGNGQKDAGRGAELDESQAFGSSSITKSADVNIILRRDKYNEDVIERNTTYVDLAKNRLTGLTGRAGEIFYENKTHRLHCKDKYLAGTHL